MKKKAELNVIVPDALEPTFANSIRITHKDDEFSLMFVQTIPNTDQARAKAIISITPQHAKRLLKALKSNIKIYEGRYGKIKLVEEPEKPSDVEVA